MHPIEANEPTEQMLIIDPTDPNDKNDPTDPPDIKLPIQKKHIKLKALRTDAKENTENEE